MYNILHKHLLKENPDYPDNEFNLLIKHISIETRLKKSIILKEREVCKFGSFVVKGCFRCFSTNSEGNQFTSLFAFEDYWVSDLYSILNKTPAKLSIEAMEDADLMTISSESFSFLLENSPAFSKFKRAKRDKAYQAALERSARLKMWQWVLL